MEGLRRQIEAAFHDEEIPTWPVLVQREISPDYTGWSASGQVGRQDLTGGKPSAPRELIKLLSSIGLTGLASWWRW